MLGVCERQRCTGRVVWAIAAQRLSERSTATCEHEAVDRVEVCSVAAEFCLRDRKRASRRVHCATPRRATWAMCLGGLLSAPVMRPGILKRPFKVLSMHAPATSSRALAVPIGASINSTRVAAPVNVRNARRRLATLIGQSICLSNNVGWRADSHDATSDNSFQAQAYRIHPTFRYLRRPSPSPFYGGAQELVENLSRPALSMLLLRDRRNR